MESKLSNNIELSLAILQHVKKSIEMLRVWNESIQSEHDYYRSHSGMEHLSASCMLLEAIGEGIKPLFLGANSASRKGTNREITMQ